MARTKVAAATRFEIYQVQCVVSGKLYIGLTSKTAEQRWKSGHLPAAMRDGATTVLARSIRKHGAENFLLSTLCVVGTFVEATQKEVEYIRMLNTLAPHGMNSTLGGDGVSMCIPEVVQKIRNAANKNWQKAEYRAAHKAALSVAVRKKSYKVARSVAATAMWGREEYCSKQKDSFKKTSKQRRASAKLMWERPGYRELQSGSEKKEKGRIAAMKRWHPEEWKRLYGGSVKAETTDDLKRIIAQLTQGAQNAG